MAIILVTRGNDQDHGGLTMSEWSWMWKTSNTVQYFEGQGHGRDVVSDNAWKQGGKEWCCEVSKDGSNVSSWMVGTWAVTIDWNGKGKRRRRILLLLLLLLLNELRKSKGCLDGGRMGKM